MLNDGSVLGEGGAKPWWWDWDGTGAQFSTAAIGQGDFLPVRGPPWCVSHPIRTQCESVVALFFLHSM